VVVATVPNPNLIEIQDEIRDDFGWKLAADLDSAKNLRWVCKEKSWSLKTWTDKGRKETLLDLQEQLISGPITILGAAAEAEDVRDAILAGHRLIAADGSVGVLTEAEFPDIAWTSLLCVVSDGDGDMVHLAMAAERKIPFVLHAHGDNQNQWMEVLDVLHLYNTPIILTHQTPSDLTGMVNPGGFTDGDRAVCFALAMNASNNQLTLRGFRTDKIGRWTGSTVPERKMRKLEWMKRVIEIAGVQM
jgi:uncharacterized Rossmann fold enzyme